LYYWDKGKTSWEPLTGGGLALAISGGTVIYEKPLAWDEVTAKPDGKYVGDLLFYPVSQSKVERWDGSKWETVISGFHQVHDFQLAKTNYVRGTGRNWLTIPTNPVWDLKAGRMYTFQFELSVLDGDPNGTACVIIRFNDVPGLKPISYLTSLERNTQYIPPYFGFNAIIPGVSGIDFAIPMADKNNYMYTDKVSYSTDIRCTADTTTTKSYITVWGSWSTYPLRIEDLRIRVYDKGSIN
jgi:hypothetical protein